MYCHKCGTPNSSMAMYCTHDGIELIKNGLDSQITLVNEHKFCPECGCNTNQQDNFCNHCGAGLHKGEYQQFELSPHVILSTNKRNLVNYLPSSFTTILRKGLFGALVSIICILFISFIISSAAAKQLNETINRELPYVQGMLGKSELTLIGVPETLLMSNLISSKMNVTVGKKLGSGDLVIQLGMISLLIIPLISLSIGGFVSARKYHVKGSIESLLMSFGVGSSYAIFLVVMSWFGGFSHVINNPFSTESVEISFGFSMIGALINGLIFGTFFSWIGSLLYMKGMKVEKDLQLELNAGVAIQQAVVTALRGIGICTLYVLVIVLIKNTNMPFWAVLLITPQLGVYLWNMVNFNPFSLAVKGEMMKASIFSGIKVPGEVVPDQFNMYVYLGLIVTVVLFIWAGKKIAAISRSSTLQNTLIFSTAYACIMTFITIVSNVNIQMHGKIPLLDFNTMSLVDGGFGTISTFFACFVTSFILTYTSTFGFRNVSSNVNHTI